MSPRLAALLLPALLWPHAARADADALWRIVHTGCEPNARLHASPAPCTTVSLQGGYAVLKASEGAWQFLLIPTARIRGIESPALLRADTPDYFARAWDARVDLQRRLGRPVPREDVALAVNAQHGRSQDQLHIHVSCVKPRVKARLAQWLPRIGPRWAPLPGKLAGKPYWARRIERPTLDGVYPFRDIAAHLPGARAAMGDQTLAAVGVRLPDGRNGFVLLAWHARWLWLDAGNAEADVQDHRCAVLFP